MEFYISAIIGVLAHLVVQIRNAQTESVIFQWKKHLINSGIMLFFALVLVYFKTEITPILTNLGIDKVLINSKLTWLAIGYCSDSVFKGIINTGAAKLKMTTDIPVPPVV